MSIFLGIIIAITAICFVNWLNAKTINQIKFFGRISSLSNLLLIIILPTVLAAWPLCIHLTIDVLLLTISIITSLGKKIA